MDVGDLERIKHTKHDDLKLLSLAIRLMAAANVITSLSILLMFYFDGWHGYAGESVRAMGLNLALCTILVVLNVLFTIVEMPPAVRRWESHIWAGKLMRWFSLLSVVLVPLTYAAMGSRFHAGEWIKEIFLVEVSVLNGLIYWCYSRGKVKLIFIK